MKYPKIITRRLIVFLLGLFFAFQGAVVSLLLILLNGDDTNLEIIVFLVMLFLSLIILSLFIDFIIKILFMPRFKNPLAELKIYYTLLIVQLVPSWGILILRLFRYTYIGVGGVLYFTVIPVMSAIYVSSLIAHITLTVNLKDYCKNKKKIR